jgi:hypothetical protein
MAEKLPTFKQLDAALKWCLDAKKDDELIVRLKHCSVSIGPGIFMRLLAWGVGYEQGPYNLPDGTTPVKDDQLPQDMGDTTIKQEFRRILTLLPDGTAKNVQQWRREEIWIEICSGLQTGERELLDLVKDQALLETYPRLTVLEKFLTGWKAPEVKKKTTRKKSSAQSVN